jgi:hypothetical protein
VNIIKQFCNPRVFLPKKCIPEATNPNVQEDAILPRHVREIAPRLKDYDILTASSNSCGEWVLPGFCTKGFVSFISVGMVKIRTRLGSGFTGSS